MWAKFYRPICYLMQSCNLSSTNTRVRSISGTKSTKSRILYHLLVPRFQKCDILFWIGGTQCHWPVASDLIIRRVRRNITMLNSKPISWCKVSDFLVRLFSSCWVVLLLLLSLLSKWSTFPCFVNHWPGLKNGPLESKPVNICSIVYDIFKHIQIVFFFNFKMILNSIFCVLDIN